MNFSSLEFIFLFFPLFFGIYYLIPPHMRNGLIFVGSMIFYAVGTYSTPAFLIIMVTVTLITYLLGILIDLFPRHGRAWIAIGVIANIGSLFVFKYAEPLFGGLGDLLSFILPVEVSFNVSSLLLPVGLSFSAFRSVSYLTDVYRAECPAERSPVNFAVFMLMFPCLIAGPITSYSEMRTSLTERRYSLDGFIGGIRVFIAGLGLKVIISDNLSAMWSRVDGIGYDSITTPLAWLAIVAYSIYIYFNFYGYSLMAIGVGRMLGFELPENFREPYMSTGMAEFWRRWHITLGGWFKKYVYIPLGGNRFGTARTLLNLLAVWLFTGMWHGATPNYPIWGLFVFMLIAAEKFLYGKSLSRHPVCGHIYMAVVIPIGWAIFAINDLSRLGLFFQRLFPFLPHEEIFAVQNDWISYLAQYWIYILAGLIFCTPLPRRVAAKLNKTLIGDILLIAAFALSIFFLCSGVSDPFMYGNF